MTITMAVRTMQAIEDTLAADQGASFRVFTGQVLPAMKDAYQGANEGFRTHLGASVIGKECARQIWYGWRWALKPNFGARILRLFNRGHLEEARFIAMLLAIGCQVYQQDSNGNQFRISDVGGHFGGSGDGVCIGLPDLASNTACLLEFKTHGEKSFIKLTKEGVRESKFEHYVQMQVYMHKMGLSVALYGAVNKNTDEVYMELVQVDNHMADQYVERARTIIMMRTAPDRINHASPGLFICRYCDSKDICFNNAPKAHNCRTCINAAPQPDGTWECYSRTRQLTNSDMKLSKALQLTGCKDFYEPL